jgi:UDP-N-acetylglucosamine 2-epimerase (non-hydrolysing)
MSISDFVELSLRFISFGTSSFFETSILSLRALNIRDAHERPEAMEEATTMMVGMNPIKVKQGINLIESKSKPVIHPVSDYQIDNVSQKVVRLLLSYYNYQIPKK